MTQSTQAEACGYNEREETFLPHSHGWRWM